MIRFAAAALVAASLLAPVAVRAEAPPPSAEKAAEAKLPSEAQDLDAVQAYLKNITTLRAKFMQTAPNRAVTSGTMSLQKPGRLRFEYLPPSPILVVSDGKVITLIDYDLKQVTRWPINDTPLRPLVRTDFMFGQDVEVLGIRRNAKSINVAITDPKKRDEGSMLLTFSRNPLTLKEWEVIDERGGSTLVQLEDLQTNVQLDKTLWEWRDPRPKRTGPPTK
jgi:outer membrane lipoprotein-sorting protein